MFRLLLFGLSLIVFSANGEHKEDLRKVRLEGLGNVLGSKFWDGEFYEFFGIPYATKPKGRDRFKPPLPPQPWNEDFKANRGILLCHQVYESDQEGEEDLLYGEENCLVTNFMVPTIASKTNLVPVIVFIHSGAYSGGNGNMAKFHYLARQDVIVASLNYRLGAIGFACLGTEEIPGNAGLKDIVAGLKFIKKHVKSFGGDPDNITLAGFSIGASLAEIVALSKESHGLFDKLALDSSSALNPFAVNRNPIDTAKNIALSIGYEDTGKLEDLNEFLIDADTQDILSVSRHFFLKNSTFGFTPCIENPDNPGAVLIESPLETMKKGNYGDFALLVGFSNMEGISRTSMFDEWKPLMNENLADFLPADLAFKNEKERDEFIKELKQYYFDGKPITLDSVQGFIDYFSDSMFKYAIMKSVKLHAENLKRSIYLYEFTYVGKLNTKHAYMDRIRGASHRDASAYILDFYDWTRNYTDMDRRDLMVTMWADFMRFENPTAYESSLLSMKWLKYTNKEPNYLNLGDELVMKKDLFAKGYQLWDKAYKNNYWTPTVVDPAAWQAKENAKAKNAPKKKPVEKKPAAEAPDAPKPIQEPEAVNPAVVKSANEKPAAEAPAAAKPIQEPKAVNPAIVDSAKEKPAAEAPAAPKPIQKPKAVNPAVVESANEKPAASKPSSPPASPNPSTKPSTEPKAKESKTDNAGQKPIIVTDPNSKK